MIYNYSSGLLESIIILLYLCEYVELSTLLFSTDRSPGIVNLNLRCNMIFVSLSLSLCLNGYCQEGQCLLVCIVLVNYYVTRPL